MSNDLIDRAIFAWMHSSYEGVFLPAMGAVSCAAMRRELIYLRDRLAYLEKKNGVIPPTAFITTTEKDNDV